MDKVAYEQGADQALVDSGLVDLEKVARFGASVEPALAYLKNLLQAGKTKFQALSPLQGAGVGAGVGGGASLLAGGDAGDVLMGMGAGGLAGGMGAGGVRALLKKYPQLIGPLESQFARHAGRRESARELMRKMMTGAGAVGAGGLGLGALT